METLFVIALSILAFGLISGRIERSVITPPMVFVLIGLLVGRWGLGIVPAVIATPFVHILATITLVLVLFTDASRIDLKLLRQDHDLPVRLLAVGLPLTIALGMLVAFLLLGGITLWEAALLAAILAPTDAALGQAVVNSPKLPVRIRQTLNVESGLNDGLALPVVLIFFSLASGQQDKGTGEWLLFVSKQVGLGPLAGILVGFVGGKLAVWGQRTGWMNHSFQDLSSLGLSLLAYASAELIGGNGFIAAFCAGLTLGNTARSICTCLYEFAEAEGQLLTLLVFMVFGAIMVPDALDNFSWPHVLYAVLSLTIIRMLPVAVSMLGMRLRWGTVFFLGWFGPRGIASILYALLLLEGSGVAGMEVILSIAMTTVLLSIFAHGLTALPGTNWYAQYTQRTSDAAEEHQPVAEMPVRLSHSVSHVHLHTATENERRN
jgi:NhaP-type Na+/H+ or K+/H+ antiporter